MPISKIPNLSFLFILNNETGTPYLLLKDFNINRFVSGDLVDEHGAAAVAH